MRGIQARRLAIAVLREGMTLVPLKLYFNPRGIAKVELGVAKGKKLHDKRQTSKERDWNRDKARLMRANFERLIDGASNAALHTVTTSGEASIADVLSIAISCVGRRLILGERTEEEIEAALNELPKGTQQIGFYSYGEISPYASGHCDLHNQTMTLTTITES